MKTTDVAAFGESTDFDQSQGYRTGFELYSVEQMKTAFEVLASSVSSQLAAAVVARVSRQDQQACLDQVAPTRLSAAPSSLRTAKAGLELDLDSERLPKLLQPGNSRNWA
jgi:hypothetical protein